MKIKYFGWVSIIVVALLILFSLPVYAGYLTYITITISNNSTSAYTYLPILVDINSTQLSNLGNIDSDGLYTNVMEVTTNRTYMVGTTKLLVLCPSVARGQMLSYKYALNYTPAKTKFPILVGVGGNITASNSTSLHLADNFTIDIYGYVDMTSGAGQNLVNKAGALQIGISGTNLTATILPSTTVTAFSIGSAYHRVTVSENTTSFGIWIDSVFVNSTTAVSVADNASDWVFMGGNTLAYADNISISTNLTPRLRYEPTTMVSPTNLPDQTANGNTGTINWGTNPSGFTVTVGSLTSGGTYTLPAPTSLPNIPGPLPSTGLIERTDEPTGMPMYDSVAAAAVGYGMTTRVLYGILILITCAVMAFGAMVLTGSIVGGMATGIIFMGAGSATGTLPAWMPVMTLAIMFFYIYVSQRA